MKKIIVLCLVALFIMSLAACGAVPQAEPTTPITPTTPVETEKPIQSPEALLSPDAVINLVESTFSYDGIDDVSANYDEDNDMINVFVVSKVLAEEVSAILAGTRSSDDWDQIVVNFVEVNTSLVQFGYDISFFILGEADVADSLLLHIENGEILYDHVANWISFVN